MATDQPLVYLILGAAGSDRRALVLDLIADGLEEGNQPAVLISGRDAPAAADDKLPRLERWSWADGVISASIPAGATHIFFVTDGRSNPVDQVEAFHPWLAQSGCELARVFCVVNCKFAEGHHALLAWYDACVHFSDVVLLNHREGVANKWMSDFQNRFKHQFIPCLFEFVKDGHVKNPAVVLDPVARRLSHLFDDEVDWVVTGGLDEDEAEGDEEVEAAPEVDPYIARNFGGRREKEIVDIAKLLPPLA